MPIVCCTNPLEEMYDSKTKMGQCSLFGKQNIVTGELEYDTALTCRSNDLKCGKDGKYYYPKKE